MADWVLRAIDAELGSRPPERGGALLGPRQPAGPDALRRRTPRRWRPPPPTRPRAQLDARVKELERGADLELKGIVHSHEHGLDGLSQQDARELAEGLRRNGHLARYLAPIVIGGRGRRARGPRAPAPGGQDLLLRRVPVHARRRRGAPAAPRQARAAAAAISSAPRRPSAARRPEALVADAADGRAGARRRGCGSRAASSCACSRASSTRRCRRRCCSLGEGEAARPSSSSSPWSLAAPPEERLVAALRTVVRGRGDRTGAPSVRAAVPR